MHTVAIHNIHPPIRGVTTVEVVELCPNCYDLFDQAGNCIDPDGEWLDYKPTATQVHALVMANVAH